MSESEAKRAVLTCLGSQKKSDTSNGPRKTIRIVLELGESNEDTCPVYNYKEELAKAERKNSTKHSNSQPKPSNPIKNGFNSDDDDEDVRRIAKEMEAKYGGAVVGGAKKKKRSNQDDYADIGMGYDESDSFIDNTDGYDEIVPENVSPVHGGFYINSGALEFKAVEAVSDATSSSSEDERSRKRPLDSSGESDDEKEEKKPKLSGGVKKKPLVGHEKLLKRKRVLDQKRKSATVKQLLNEKRVDLDMSVSVVSSPGKTDAKICDAIESVVKGIEEKSVNTHNSNDNGVSDTNANKVLPISSEGDSSLDGKPDVENVNLPENLPRDIVEIVSSIKTAAANSPVGKVKFFTSPVNKMLLNLERQCKCIGKQSRMKVYEHLAPFVRCKKETLIKRAKNLVVESEAQNLERLKKNIKDSIDLIMPGVLENYELESQRIKNLAQDSSKDKKPMRLPHRKFPWNENLKKLVKDVVMAKKRVLQHEGKQKTSIDSLLIEFLKKEIQSLWPNGWVSIYALSKVCGIVLEQKKPSITTTLQNKIQNTNTNSTTANTNRTEQKHPQPQQQLPFNLSGALSITPVPYSSEKKSVSKPQVKQTNTVENVVLGKCLPEVEITKTLNAVLENQEVKRTKSVLMHTEEEVKQTPPKEELIVLDDSPPERASSPTPLPPPPPLQEPSKPPQNEKVSEQAKEAMRCQVIDLTSNNNLPELKRKPGPKSKTRYYTDGEKVRKAKQISDEITGSSALDQIITKSLNEPPSTAGHHDVGVDYSNKRHTSEGDSSDIQMVMEGLKNLQKMSSPVKPSTDNSNASSPVSVIAYSKSYSPKTTASASLPPPLPPPLTPSTSGARNECPVPRNEYTKADFAVGFQEAFQKQFLADFNYYKTGGQGPSSQKRHTMGAGGGVTGAGQGLLQVSEKYQQPQQQPSGGSSFMQQNQMGKFGGSGVNNSAVLQPKRGGDDGWRSYNKMLLDDMLANFLSEYGGQKQA